MVKIPFIRDKNARPEPSIGSINYARKVGVSMVVRKELERIDPSNPLLEYSIDLFSLYIQEYGDKEQGDIPVDATKVWLLIGKIGKGYLNPLKSNELQGKYPKAPRSEDVIEKYTEEMAGEIKRLTNNLKSPENGGLENKVEEKVAVSEAVSSSG